ncbi:helix-turn-helix transcriptional regulator [Panacagrimonas sp.]|uniref:helix-turn-helix transcriptional regulator n=1 Tax=Panacagrimonas sp. TaxID=2480088 RepID=UPI003B515CA0
MPTVAPRSAAALQSSLGSRVRRLRARRGITRKVLAQMADVSERHLANLEAGEGNPSILILSQIAGALDCSLAELLGDETTDSPEWLLIRDLLHGRSQTQLEAARHALTSLFGGMTSSDHRLDRIALIGLRGAGKSTLGRALAKYLERPLVDLNREIERIAGCRPDEIHALYGPAAYRRYERRALDEAVDAHPLSVIDTPGGIVTEAATFNLLLSRCYTLWLTASPEEHMNRVIAQGDLRPMAGNRQAMDDLRLILEERTPFYAKADLVLDTSGKSAADCLSAVAASLDEALARRL